MTYSILAMLLPLVVLLAPAALASGYTCDSLLPALCPLQERHGTVEVRGATLHYWTYAPEGWSQVPDSLLPVVTIHGGPGFPHNYLLPLKLLACQGRQVVFYDQVGSGSVLP
jgi:poly(3-hydroxybutyrate) depolymerase